MPGFCGGMRQATMVLLVRMDWDANALFLKEIVLRFVVLVT